MSETKNQKPNRGPDEEAHGEGPPSDAVRTRAEEAYYAELFVDALGDPDNAPLGWWHLKLWNGP